MLDNGKRSTLTEQLVEKIRSDIRSGTLAPGQKLPGERILAEKFGICRVTVISALKRLENEGLIEKIPQRGSFVKDHSLPARVALVCPDENLGRLNDMEQIFSFFEFHRGVLAEAMARGVPVGVECIPRAEAEEDPRRFAAQFERYDSLIFESRNHPQLRKEFYGKKRLIVNSGPIVSEEDFSHCTYLTYDQRRGFADLISKARHLGWQDFTIVMMDANPWFQKRCRRFCEEAQKLGVSVQIVNCFDDTPAGELSRCCGTFVFCNHTKFFHNFYCKCREAGLVPGQDFALSGLCTGFTLGNLDPAPGFIRIPTFELGREAMRLALGFPAAGKMLRADIIDGKTITPNKKER